MEKLSFIVCGPSGAFGEPAGIRHNLDQSVQLASTPGRF